MNITDASIEICLALSSEVKWFYILLIKELCFDWHLWGRQTEMSDDTFFFFREIETHPSEDGEEKEAVCGLSSRKGKNPLKHRFPHFIQPSDLKWFYNIHIHQDPQGENSIQWLLLENNFAWVFIMKQIIQQEWCFHNSLKGISVSCHSLKHQFIFQNLI